MKNQYFGDKRDFFKYNLLLDLLECLDLATRTFIPMLTPDDGTNEGYFKRYKCKDRRGDLNEFLKSNKEISSLSRYFKKYSFVYYHYKDNIFFKHSTRKEYFSSIPHKYLQGSLIFIDPDIGLETGECGYMRQKGLEKYLFYYDVESIVKEAATPCLFAIYQHLQRDQRKVISDLTYRSEILSAIIRSKNIGYLKDHDIAFLVGSGSNQVLDDALIVLQNHSKYHGVEYGVV